MKLIPVSKDDIPAGRTRSSKYQELLAEFVSSNHDAAKIDTPPKSPQSASTRLRHYIKKNKYPVTVRVAGKDIYLVKN